MDKGDTFVFYPSFYEDLQGITDDRVKLRVYEAIICYGCYGIEADLSDIDQFGILASLVKRVSSSIDAAKEKRQRISQARSAAGKKGGAPAGNQNARKNEVIEIEETSEKRNKQMLEETNNSLEKQTNQPYNVLCNDVNIIIPPNTPPKGAKPKPPKEKTLNTKAKEIFEEYYKDTFGNNYYWSAKDAGGMAQLLKKIKFQLGGEPTDDMLIDSLRSLLSSITDKWVLEHMSIPILNSKYNEILPKSRPTTFQQVNNNVNDLWNR